MKVNEAIFRDYDIRGIVGRDLDEQFANIFGKAFGTYLIRKGTGEVIVGYDARETSPSYFRSCVDGLLSCGINVIRVGMITSPMMYWARKFYQIDGGLIITASHNPPEFNGFKPASGNGALFGEAIQDLKRLMMSEDFVSGNGKASDREIFADYKGDICSKVKITRPVSVVVDCGNSTAGPYAPKVLEALGVSVRELFCNVDPKFPNHPPDPENPAAYPAIVDLMRGGEYDIGLLFDGDADRLGAVDGGGNVVRGDQITALCARKVLEDKPGAKVLFEVQCSKSATDDVEKNGGKSVLVRVGHSYIEQALIDEKAELAGETSGHVFFVDRWYGFDDAIYAACRLVEYVSEVGKTLSELVETLPKYISVPKTRITAPDSRKFEIVEELKKYFFGGKVFEKIGSPKLLDIDGIRLEWDDGWIVVRASNTQPALTLRAEAKTEKRLEELKKLMEDALLVYKSEGVKLEWGRTD
ncbi:MAG: phosphomannomutase/phosphoglucomutase [Candidatus Curtissbacteria bacterium]|nr:phosphomannomutase/phosphoglucomutase [Candidatus Curtissbacteria bacterium]